MHSSIGNDRPDGCEVVLSVRSRRHIRRSVARSVGEYVHDAVPSGIDGYRTRQPTHEMTRDEDRHRTNRERNASGPINALASSPLSTSTHGSVFVSSFLSSTDYSDPPLTVLTYVDSFRPTIRTHARTGRNERHAGAHPVDAGGRAATDRA